MELYRVLLVDDEEDIRVGISRKMDWNSLGFQLVGEAENGAEALELSEQLHPDVVLTDIKMPFMDGLELCRRLNQSLPAAKLVVFSGFDDFECARQAVRMNVFEYILKPINAPELGEVMTRLKQELDRQQEERRDMESLRRIYEENLPVLREMFYARLLSGHIAPGEIQDRAARYEITLPQGIWTACLVHMGTPSGDEAAERDELLLLSVRDFIDERFELEGCSLRAVLYNDTVALLACMEGESGLYPLLDELNRICMLARSYLGLRLSIGVGSCCGEPKSLHSSMDGARSALEYRVVVEDTRVLYIGDLEPDRSARLSFGEDEQRAMSAAVKLGTEEQISEIIQQLVARVRSARMSPSQVNQFFLEIVIFLIKLTRSGGVELEAVFGDQFNWMISINDFPTLDEVSNWLEERCCTLRALMGQKRNDSAGRTIAKAEDFISRHYQDSDLSVETICSYLHFSPAYFSTLFKREVGMSFIAYVTEKRMKEASRLLRETDEKTYLIAEQTGFADPNYFSYVFKRQFGLSPSKYRASQKV